VSFFGRGPHVEHVVFEGFSDFATADASLKEAGRLLYVRDTATFYQDDGTELTILGGGAIGAGGDGSFSGFSARFGEVFVSTDVVDTLDKILQISYSGPQVSLTATGSTTVREKGQTVTSTTLQAAVTVTSAPIARIQFFRDGASINDNNPPANINSGATNYVYSVPFSDNVTFRADVTDDGTGGGGPSTTSASRSFTFVYPYYYGVGSAGLTPAQVAALTKDVRTETSSYNRSFGAATGQVYYFAYPASYGTLSSIIDSNGFETFGDWTLTVANITGTDASPVSYNIYEFNNVVFAGGTNYIFSQ